LLLEWCARNGGLYTVADPSSAAVQRRYMAEAIASRFGGFRDVDYPDWRSLLSRLAGEAKAAGWRGPIVLDELPYLVASSPELAGILQRWVDHEARDAGLTVVLAGSSQRMMQGMVLDAAAPLYGRATEAFALAPLPVGRMQEALGIEAPADAVRFHSVWGGIPRYWELAQPYGGNLAAAVNELVLDPLGPLHLEPERLLVDEVPPAASLRSVLDAVGMGANRTTEIAGRMGQPATSLARALTRLQSMGLLERVTPFGESERAGKKSLYRIADPFVRAWFRMVAPNRAYLAAAGPTGRLALWRKHAAALAAAAWEDLCRRAVPMLTGSVHALGALGPWGPAGRFWRGGGPEWDVVAVSPDGRRVLLGEAKWPAGVPRAGDIRKTVGALVAKGVPPIGDLAGREVVRAVFTPREGGEAAAEGVHVVDAAAVVACLRG
jgi:AAA+ ATPase superfamily predicted ATPase